MFQPVLHVLEIAEALTHNVLADVEHTCCDAGRHGVVDVVFAFQGEFDDGHAEGGLV